MSIREHLYAIESLMFFFPFISFFRNLILLISSINGNSSVWFKHDFPIFARLQSSMLQKGGEMFLFFPYTYYHVFPYK